MSSCILQITVSTIYINVIEIVCTLFCLGHNAKEKNMFNMMGIFP